MKPPASVTRLIRAIPAEAVTMPLPLLFPPLLPSPPLLPLPEPLVGWGIVFVLESALPPVTTVLEDVDEKTDVKPRDEAEVVVRAFVLVEVILVGPSLLVLIVDVGRGLPIFVVTLGSGALPRQLRPMGQHP